MFFTKVHICWVKELKCNLEANKIVVIWDTSHGHVTVSGHKKLSPILPSCSPLYFWLHHEKMWFNNRFLKICKLNCCFHAAINNPCTVFSIFFPQYLETTRKQLTAKHLQLMTEQLSERTGTTSKKITAELKSRIWNK